MKLKKTGILVLWCLCAYCFLFESQSAIKGVTIGLNICAAAVLPSLFPFFILTNFWISAGYADKLSHIAEPLTERLFHLPGSATSALILGSIGGYPIGIKTTANLYDAGVLTKEEAGHLCLFCNNAGPAFVLNVIGVLVFQSTSTGIILYIIHLFSAYLIGILLRPKQYAKQHIPKKCTNSPQNLSSALTTAITDGGNTAVLVSTYILFFSILTQSLQTLLPHSPIIAGLLELAGGAKLLSEANLTNTFKFISAAFLLGFGGLCVMLQSLSILQKEGLSGKKLLIGKALHGILSAIIAAILAPHIPAAHPCGMNSFARGTQIAQTTLIMICIFFVLKFLKKSSGNVE